MTDGQAEVKGMKGGRMNNLEGEGRVLTVTNRHIKGSGEPPDLKADEVYTAYFENDYREQLVFQYDSKEKKGTLWHGDYGWEDPVDVMAGATTLILSQEEQTWLALVWRVATRRESNEFHILSEVDLNQAQIKVYEDLLTHPTFQDDEWVQEAFKRSIESLRRQREKLRKRLADALSQEGRG